jgi:cbb3-type cytochrome oxidase subunit 3
MKISKKIAATALTLSLLAVPTLAFGQIFGDQLANPTGTQGGSDIIGAVITILNGLLVLAALAALIIIIVGGVRYIFSQGDEENAAAAKNTILYAVVGLIVIGLAAVLVNFIFNVIAGTT